MEALSHSESRRKYSWWWDSHISPKNSKWLQENLTDMDSKVKSMIKLIEEDADSFARRAEMYYKKRPELMKLVEEFYRAYLALAERYDYATCEFRHAHRTIAKAFPDHQVPFELAEDSPSRPPSHSRDPRTPESKFPVRALLKDGDGLLNELPESIQKEGSIKLHEMPNDKGEVSPESECEVRASESEIEVWTMKEAVVQLEAENKDGSVKHEECLDKISKLEAMLFQIQDEAESDGRALKDEIIKLEFKKEEMLCHCNECLEKISVLENVVSVSEKEASLLRKNAKILHQEITRLKDEIEVLNRSYRAIVEQVEAVGLSPKCCGPSIKNMQDENKLLLKRLENAESLLKEKAISENHVLASSQEEVKAMHESCRILEGEKATLAAEKGSLLSQLETITETMHKLLEKNAVLENSFCAAKIELGGLRERSKGLEEICELLRNEGSFLLTERGVLASKLENVERRLKNMEKRYNGLERKYADLEKEKTSSKLQSDSKLAGLKNEIHFLQEENSWKNKEFEEELERSLKSQFEISILQKFMKEMEEKNRSLVVECQKHVEALKLAEKLIFGLESEILELQVESKILLDEIEWLRLGVYRIFKALETVPDCEGEDKILKCSVSKHKDDKQGLLVENSVLSTLLEQLESKGTEIVSEKSFLEMEIKVMKEKLGMAEKEKEELYESNRKLEKDMNFRSRNFAVLEAEMENLRKKKIGLSKDFYALEEAYALANRTICDLEEEKNLLDQLNDSAETLNLKLCKTVDELETDIQESVRVEDDREAHILQLSGDNAAQNLEIESLRMVQMGLESELVQLREDIEDKIIRERILSFELEEKNKEFGLWEADASALYFDLQISAVDGILYRDKLQELAGMHWVLENENDSKNMEIEGMKVRIGSMESEISELKSQLCAHRRIETNKPTLHRRSSSKQHRETKPSESLNPAMRMKDIPLDRISNTDTALPKRIRRRGSNDNRVEGDQMLELWEKAAESSNCELTIGESLKLSSFHMANDRRVPETVIIPHGRKLRTSLH